MVVNRAALVTGAGRGMGEAFARALCAAGANVVLSDIDGAAATAVAESIGDRAFAVEHDARSAESWADAVAAAETRFGPISILVNNAAIAWFATLEDSDEQATREMIDINLMSVFLGMKAILPTMRRAGGGSIVNNVAVASLHPPRGLFSYSACKWAVRGMTKCAAQELGADGIRVNAIHPGMIDTNMTVGMDAPTTLPIPRKGRPDEVADLVVFLASDASAYITGGDFAIDGGMSAGAG